jgi:hypothetical protein
LERRDYLQKQIDQLGKVLGRIIADFLSLKTEGFIDDGVVMTQEALKAEVDLDVDTLLNVPAEQLLAFLQVEKKLNNDHIESVAELLYLLGESQQELTERKVQLFERTLVLYEHLNKTATAYSFDREVKMEVIKGAIGNA